ncbi:MAG: N-acetyl-gamma-glutamyl-phosphate reductase, partial [Planctomycetota bacterium]
MTITANVIGASGYTGGELLRLLVGHPDVEIAAATSRQFAGKPLHRNHPHLRGVTDLSYSHHDETEPSDVAFLCLPHGRAQQEADRWLALGRTVIDLSADFRLPPVEYQEWYGEEHAAPERVASAVYGLPELTRDRLPGAGLISGVGCNATAINLALLPLARHELIERVICDIKVGSSEAGATATDASHHPERSGATRTYAPAGHRHAGEVSAHLCKNCGRIPLDVTVTAIEMVRGVLCTAHVLPRRELTPPELFRLFREAYDDEPFDPAFTNNGKNILT